MHLLQLSVLCTIVLASSHGTANSNSSSDGVYQPQYYQSVPYQGEITQNIDQGEGIQEVDYDPTVSQIIVNGKKGNGTVFSSNKIECNPVYTQEAPYSGIFNQNISSEANGIQKLDYRPTFLQQESNVSQNAGSGQATFTQSAPYAGVFEQQIQGSSSVGNQSVQLAPNFSQNQHNCDSMMVGTNSTHFKEAGDQRYLKDNAAAYTQDAPFTTSQNQEICENSTGYQNLIINPNFNQNTKNFTVMTSNCAPHHGMSTSDTVANATYVQENSFSGIMSQNIGQNGRGTQKSKYAPSFDQNEQTIQIVQADKKLASGSDGSYSRSNFDDVRASAKKQEEGETYHQNSVYNNEMHQIIHPGGAGHQSSHFSPVFTQNNKKINYNNGKPKSKKRQRETSKSKNDPKLTNY